MRAGLPVLLITLLTAASPAGAQTTLVGRVFDSATGAPLGFTHIQLDGTAFGTAAAADGRFVLRVPALPARLRLSRVGYRVRMVEVAALSDSLRLSLEAAVLPLGEVVVDARYAERLAERAFARCASRRNARIRGRAFYRQLTRSDSLHTEWIETFYDTAVSCAGIERWEVEQGRYALREDALREDFAHHRDFFAFSRRLNPVQKIRDRVVHADLPLRNRPGKRFSFTLEGRTAIDDRPVAVVRYSPRSDRHPAFAGLLYIDERTADVLRYEGAVHHRRFRPLHWEGDRRIFLVDQEMRFVMDFRTVDTTTAPTLVQVDVAYTQVAGRGDERAVAVTSTLLFYDFEPGAPRRLRHRRTDAVSDYEAIDRRPYDAAFWQANDVLAEHPVEAAVRRAFESTDSFGALFGGAPKPR